MGRWKRPYPRSLETVAAGGGCVVFAAVAVLTAVLAIRGLVVGHLEFAGGTAVASALIALATWVTFRAARYGLFVDARGGVLIRRFDTTTSWSWSTVSAVQSRPARLLTYGLPPGNETIWLVLTDGEEVETPLRSLDAKDYNWQWQRQAGVVWLDRSDFALALWTMHDLHRAASTR